MIYFIHILKDLVLKKHFYKFKLLTWDEKFTGRMRLLKFDMNLLQSTREKTRSVGFIGTKTNTNRGCKVVLQSEAASLIKDLFNQTTDLFHLACWTEHSGVQ